MCSSSATDVGTVFRTMFLDTAIAAQFSCGERKASYIIGLAPHSKDLLLKSLQEVPVYVILFDKSYNQVMKDKQMDIPVHCWTSTNCITSVCVKSMFTGRGRSDDMLNVSCLQQLKALQVSMDRPKVNCVFYHQLQNNFKLNCNVQMFNLGSCGLPVVHGAWCGCEQVGSKQDITHKISAKLEEECKHISQQLIHKDTKFQG